MADAVRAALAIPVAKAKCGHGKPRCRTAARANTVSPVRMTAAHRGSRRPQELAHRAVIGSHTAQSLVTSVRGSSSLKRRSRGFPSLSMTPSEIAVSK
jgi:hypothetical protein